MSCRQVPKSPRQEKILNSKLHQRAPQRPTRLARAPRRPGYRKAPRSAPPGSGALPLGAGQRRPLPPRPRPRPAPPTARRLSRRGPAPGAPGGARGQGRGRSPARLPPRSPRPGSRAGAPPGPGRPEAERAAFFSG